MSQIDAVVQADSRDAMVVNYADYSILLVDDTPNNLDVLVAFLTEYGFNLRVALSGESALQRIHYAAPDLVLLDVLLPGIDGFETCRQLKADANTRDIPIIFMTSLASAEDKVRGFEAGAVDYVTKPLQQAEVLARIVMHLRQRGQTETLRMQVELLTKSHRAERERLLQAVAQHRDQLRSLTAKVTSVQEEERQHLARELHDEMGQALTAIRMNLAAITHELAAASPRTQERLLEAVQLTDQTLEQIRELSLDLRPSMLDDLGLVPTLRWYLKRFRNRTNIDAQLVVDRIGSANAEVPKLRGVENSVASVDFPQLSTLLATTLYRITQEALTNVARHSQASQLLVHLATVAPDEPMAQAEMASVVLRIEDNGRGFVPDDLFGSEAVPLGAGLLGMRERVAILGGVWQLASAPDAGTQIHIRLPLKGAHE